MALDELVRVRVVHRPSRHEMDDTRAVPLAPVDARCDRPLRPEGAGPQEGELMDRHTHYIPAFTRRNERGEQESACRLFVPSSRVAPLGVTPTCWGCALWLHNVEHPRQRPEERARVLAKITEETPWGNPLEVA